MKRFVELFLELDATTRTSRKVAVLERYFREVLPGDAAWALRLLAGDRLPSLVPVTRLRAWAGELAGLPAWLVEACHENVGDLAETLALLPPDPSRAESALAEASRRPAAPRQMDLFEEAPARAAQTETPGGLTLSLRELVEGHLLPMASLPEQERLARLARLWLGCDANERLVLNKLVTGAFRVGVQRTLVVRAVASALGVDAGLVAGRVAGRWEPTAEEFRALGRPAGEGDDDPSRPYPFCLASPLEEELSMLGDPSAWRVEWKWDGIRAQLIRRAGRPFVWSRGEEDLTARFPELRLAAEALPDGTVLDGELLVWPPGSKAPAPFADLQHRIGRRRPTTAEVASRPVVMLVYDLLEHDGQDWRSRPLEERQAAAEALLARHGASASVRLAPRPPAANWQSVALLRADSRARGVEGVMIKRLGSPYRQGRVKGDWWKWKVDPLVIDAVLVGAQAGHGRRAGLFTDYTFALWRGDELVPVAKAYSGLTDAEIRRLDAWIQQHVTARHGPVRSVEPVHVFELGFDAVQRSPRHRSGLAVRFPRILRWRTDKPAREADTVEALASLA